MLLSASAGSVFRRLAEIGTVGVAQIEMDDVAAEQTMDTVHARKIQKRLCSRFFTFGQSQCFAAFEPQIPAAITDPACPRPLALSKRRLVEQHIQRHRMPVGIATIEHG